MNNIGNKLFAYIGYHGNLTVDMINQYKNSLIVLGDENQMFIPAINSYIGISNTKYQDLLSRISDTTSDLIEFNKYIHKDTVTSIYAQFSPEDVKAKIASGQNTINGINVTNDSAYTAFKTNTNVVLKGYNKDDGLADNVTTVNSGITIGLKRGGNFYNGTFVLNGQSYTYTYYQPYDTITIDDTKTWSYIAYQNTYMTNFIANFSSQQADRVYKNLIGETGEIYIEKEFNEAFLVDGDNISEYRDVYVKTSNDDYAKVTVDNNVIKIDGTNTIIKPETDDITELNGILYNDNTGYETISRNNTTYYRPIWYHQDLAPTSTYNININDGIQTIKEVAHILDQITDGGQPGYDTGIQLAYNIATNYDEIQKLKKWQEGIGNETVSAFKSESNNDLLTVNYYSHNLWDKDRDDDGFSTGKVKLDLDLVLAQIYTLNGISYAAYLQNHDVPDEYKTYFIFNGDTTYVNNYKKLDTSVTNNNKQIHDLLKQQNPSLEGNSTPTIGTYAFIYDPNDNTKITGVEHRGNVTLDQINNSNTNLNGRYIYFPYILANYDFTKGLTTVQWVTSYVREVYNDLSNTINNLNVSDQISDAIELLAYNDTDYSYQGMFVSEVDETNGIISVKRTKLPLSYIIHNDIISNEDLFLNVTVLEAKKLLSQNSSIYTKSGNNYHLLDNSNQNDKTILNNINGPDEYWRDDLYVKQNINSMQQVPTNTTYTNLIINHGQTSYFIKSTTGGKIIYAPIDVIQENTSGNLNSNITSGNIYYWNKSIVGFNKYLEVSYVQNYNGSTTTKVNSYITYLSMASATSTGLADAWDVRRNIESIFQWVDIKTNKIIG